LNSALLSAPRLVTCGPRSAEINIAGDAALVNQVFDAARVLRRRPNTAIGDDQRHYLHSDTGWAGRICCGQFTPRGIQAIDVLYRSTSATAAKCLIDPAQEEIMTAIPRLLSRWTTVAAAAGSLLTTAARAA
jgi:hypothetical protein